MKKINKKNQYLTGSNGNSESIWKAINELTNKNYAANASRTKDISANELNIHFSTTAEKDITVNRTESNDLCALKEFCYIKHIQSAPPLLPPPSSGLQRTHTCKANWNSWSGRKNTQASCTR